MPVMLSTTGMFNPSHTVAHVIPPALVNPTFIWMANQPIHRGMADHQTRPTILMEGVSSLQRTKEDFPRALKVLRAAYMG